MTYYFKLEAFAAAGARSAVRYIGVALRVRKA
jgi:hypothetical protein